MAFKLNPLTGKFDLVSNAGGSSEWLKLTSSITAAATVDVDTLLLTQFEQLQYIVQIKNADRSKNKSFNLTVGRDGGDISDQMFAVYTKDLNVTVDPKISGSNFTLTITNNEAETIDVSLARIFLG